MGNKSLGEYFGRPKESISRTISKLKKLGYIREEKDGTLRKLYSTDKENIYNYGVIGSDKTVISNDKTVIYDDKTVNVDDKVVMLKSLLNDGVVIRAMTKSLSNDDEVVKHNIRLNIRYIIKDLNIEEKPKTKEIITDDWQPSDSILKNIKDRGYQQSQIEKTREQFINTILATNNKYKYKNFDRAFLNWITKEQPAKEENEFLRGL